MVNNKPTFISLFAGCGGSSLGYKWAGFKELLAIDFDKNAVETFRLNFPDVLCWQRDIREVTGKEILDFCKIEKGELDLLDASPPCQGFSTVGKRKVLDPRNDLFKEFVRLIKDLEPKVFVMENVSGLAKGKMKGRFIEIIQELKSLPYQVKCKLMNALYYEVPQSRPRLIWIGIRKDLKQEIDYPSVGKIVQLKEALKSVPSDEIIYPEGRAAEISPKLRQWQDGADIIRDSFFNLKKLAWRKPSRTVTKTIRFSQCGLLHPDEDRFLTIAELKRVASFPDEYQFIGEFREKWAVIGNSVPPKFMEAIAKSIKEQVFDHG